MKKIIAGVSVVVVAIALVALALVNPSQPTQDIETGNVAPGGQTLSISTTVPSDFTVNQ